MRKKHAFLHRSGGAGLVFECSSYHSLQETTTPYPKSLSFADVVHAFSIGRYRTAGVISFNLVRNRLSATNSGASRCSRGWSPVPARTFGWMDQVTGVRGIGVTPICTSYALPGEVQGAVT